MPFHEIREVSFKSLFNSTWDRRRRPLLTRGTTSHGRGIPAGKSNPDKDVDFWA